MKNNKKKVSLAAIPEDDWQTRSDFRTLCDAEEIKKDPKRMEKVKAFAQQQMQSTASVLADCDE